jgi:hypothetical protein
MSRSGLYADISLIWTEITTKSNSHQKGNSMDPEVGGGADEWCGGTAILDEGHLSI